MVLWVKIDTDVWRLEIVGGQEGEVVNTVNTVTTKLKKIPHALWNYITLSLARLAPSSLASPLVHCTPVWPPPSPPAATPSTCSQIFLF